MNQKAKIRTDNEEKIMHLSLLQAESAFNLDLNLDKETHKGLSEIDDLNTLLTPTKITSAILKRWEIVHQIDLEYPYPKDEIAREDWMGMNEFLHEDGFKAKMTYDEDNNIDSDVLDYIMSGTPSDHPVVKKAMARIESE